MTTIGTSSLDVYPLCLGTNSFGWTAELDAARGVLDEYVGNGGNFIDTADVYGRHKEGNVGGESEAMIGAWMAGRNREELVVATKVGFMNPGGELSATRVRGALTGSLRNLGTDYVDLYYAHRFDEETPIAESVAAFAREQQAGRIREVGLSNMSPEQIRQWIEAADEQGPVPATAPRRIVMLRTIFERHRSHDQRCEDEEYCQIKAREADRIDIGPSGEDRATAED